ncbi:MAG: glycosyltransferase, partial [Bacteroidota bacterium]
INETNIVNLDVPITKNPTKKATRIFKMLKRVGQAKKDNGIQVTISHLYIYNFLNVMSRRRDKSICVMHGPASLYFNKPSYYFGRWFYKKSDAIVCMSKYFKHQTIKELGVPEQRVHCIYNPIDLEKINRLKLEAISDEKEKSIFENRVFIYVGRFQEQKAQWHAIRAFSKVHAKHKDTHLVFLGDGDEKILNYLETLVNDYGLNNNVHFFGRKSNPFKYVANAFCTFYTARWDGLPMVLLESLACNTPAISSDSNSGPREILDPSSDFLKRTQELEIVEYGILCKTCDGNRYNVNEPLTEAENQFADAASILIEQKDVYTRFQENASDRAKRFSIDSITNAYEQLSRALVANEN